MKRHESALPAAHLMHYRPDLADLEHVGPKLVEGAVMGA